MLNIILLTAVIYLADYTIFHLNLNVKFTPTPIKKTVEEKESEVAQEQVPSPAEYTIIAEQNLFHPERIIPPEKSAGPPVPKPEFVLYGTLITDNLAIAYMEDKKSPQSTPGREKRQTALRKGDTLSGYVLKEVLPDAVIMAKGGEFIDVSLSAPKTRESAVAAQPAGAAQPPGAVAGPAGGPLPSRRGSQPSAQTGAPGSVSSSSGSSAASSGQQQPGAQAESSSSPGQQPSAAALRRSRHGREFQQQMSQP